MRCINYQTCTDIKCPHHEIHLEIAECLQDKYFNSGTDDLNPCSAIEAYCQESANNG